MGASTHIQWCDHTFNPWMGCRKVAPECANCYIVGQTPLRVRGIEHGAHRERTAASTWKQPLAWNRKASVSNCLVGSTRPRVFCLSLGDWLDDEVPIEWLADLLALIHVTPSLDWLLLTKRPRNWRARAEAAFKHVSDLGARGSLESWLARAVTGPIAGAPPVNVWIGVSAGADQAAALEIPAKVHFLSCEPMLGPMDTTHAGRFDWIIFGGESGKNARRCHVDWIRDGVRFCRENQIAAFVKQLGADPRDFTGGLMVNDKKGGDMSEWPEDLRVREFPTEALLAAGE